jgi:hypothetical protein
MNTGEDLKHLIYTPFFLLHLALETVVLLPHTEAMNVTKTTFQSTCAHWISDLDRPPNLTEHIAINNLTNNQFFIYLFIYYYYFIDFIL